MIEGYTIWDGVSQIDESNKLDVCWGDSTDIVWDHNPYCWDDVFLVKELLDGAGGDPSHFIPIFQDFPEEKKDQFITLVCKVHGYGETKETKQKLKSSITAKQIELTVNEVIKSVDLKIIKG